MGKRRQFHCLDGVLRDLVAALADDEGEGYQRLLDFVRIIADILEILEDDDADLPDADDAPAGERQLDLDIRDQGNGTPVGGPVPGHAPGLTDGLVGPAGLGDPMERVRALAEAAARGVPASLVPAMYGRRLVGGAKAKA